MPEHRLNILMVCLGNICRSPTAEVVFRDRVAKAGLEASFHIDSAGTGYWHVGQPPDERACRAALERGYDMSGLRGRQVSGEDFARFDYILAMDRKNLDVLTAMAGRAADHKVSLFLAHGSSEYDEVPDPYYAGADGFELVLDLVEDASDHLLQALVAKHGLT